MKKTIVHTLSALGLALALTTSVGCKKDSAFEEAGENIDEAIEDAGDAVEDAAEETGDAIEEAGEEIKNAGN